MGYLVGSFNIQDFTGDGLYKKRGTPEGTRSVERDLKAIAGIILGERFDVVALQEVRDYRAVDWLKKHLCILGGQNWKSYCDISTPSEPEFAFLWNAGKIRIYRDMNDQPVMPVVLREYEGYPGGFERPPYYGRFTPISSPKTEIRLINVHLKSGECAQTKNEFKLLANDVYRRVDSERPGTNMDIYTLILGDYNLKCAKYCNVCEAGDPKVYRTATRQMLPTTLKRKEPDYTDNDFDHFGYDVHTKGFSNINIVPVFIDLFDKISLY